MAWIKFDKSLVNDPRVLHAAGLLADEIEVKRLGDLLNQDPVSDEQSYAIIRNAVIGALCALWVYADTHIRDGDVLPISASDVDRLVGIEGFCAMLGPEWVQQPPNQNTVILPGYSAKNGLETKEKRAAANAERQRRFRESRAVKVRGAGNGSSNGVSNGHVTALDRDRDRDRDLNHKEPLRAPDGLDQEAWNRWLAYRKSSGKALKPASHEAAMRAMVKFGKDQAAVVEQSIAQGWTGLFALKANGHSPPNSEALAAWDALLASNGAKRDAKAQKAIEAVGGWAAIQERTINNGERIKQRFCQEYTR